MELELSSSVECDSVPACTSRSVLMMATIRAPPWNSIGSHGAPGAPLTSPAEPARATGEKSMREVGVGCLEGCGLGWRVRPPISRRSPWTVVAQRIRLCVEAVGGCSIEKLYTLLDHNEVSPRVSFEVALQDLHPGDVFHLPVRVSVPVLGGATTSGEAVRFSLAYVDAATIEAKTSAVGVSVARPQESRISCPPSSAAIQSAIALDRERLRVIVSEALQHAAAQANAGHMAAAVEMLAEVESAVAAAPSTQCGEPLSIQVLESVLCARHRLNVAQRAAQKPQHGALANDRVPAGSLPPGSPSPTSLSSSPAFVMGGSVSEPGRTPLRPRTFSVALPLGSPTRGEPTGGGSFSPGGPGNPLFLPTAASAAAESPPAAHAQSPLRRMPTAHRKEGDSILPLPSSGDSLTRHGDLSPLSLFGGSFLSSKPPLSLRLFGTVHLATGKRLGRGPMLRGRPRLQPPVLMPLHAPPTASADAPAGVPPPLQLASIPPLPPPGTRTRARHGSYESWLCRLLRSSLQPLPLPDEIIVHIFTFVEPIVLFHPSLSLPTLVVDKASCLRGHHATIASALRAVQPGERILIRPGVYRESLVLNVPVAIIGCPAPGGGPGVTITSSRNHTVHSTALFARLDNVLLRQTGGSGRSCLLCSHGTLEVSDCDISSASGLCVEVTDAATPIIRHSRVHSGAAAGIWFRSAAGGLVEGNEIWGNGWSGVQISDGSNPTLLRNFIHDNKSAGLISFNHGRGVALHNDITSNGKGGVQVRSRASPELSHNRIFSERSFGVWVYEHGFGTFEDNDIVNNAWSGFQVEEGSDPTVMGNRLRGNRSAGIVVYNRGAGTYEWNDISANGRCGVQIKSGSTPVFRRNRIHHEKQAGVLTAEDGTGVLEENDIFDNQWSGVQTEGPSNPKLVRNRIHHNGGAGFIAYQSGSGLLDGNCIYSNKKYGVQAKTGGQPTVRNNTIHDKAYGIYLSEAGGGVYEGNTISNAEGSGIYVSADCSPTMSNNHGAS